MAPGVELNQFYSMIPVTGVALLMQRLMIAPSLEEISDEMEYFAELASEADSEEEVDYFLGTIASLAGPLISSFLQEDEYDGFD